MAYTRFTVDMPKRLYDDFTASADKVDFTKAQYVRMALEVLNMLSAQPGCTLSITRDGETQTLLIPGITK